MLQPGAEPELHAPAPSRIMICGGAPLGERHIHWNFVASDRADIETAKRDWASAARSGFPEGGRFALPPGETEHIPLPEDLPAEEPVKPSANSPTS